MKYKVEAKTDYYLEGDVIAVVFQKDDWRSLKENNDAFDDAISGGGVIFFGPIGTIFKEMKTTKKRDC